MRTVLTVQASDTQLREKLEDLLLLYSSFLVSGDETVTDEATQMADTASYEMNYDRLSVLVRVEIDALFEYDPSDSDRTADSPPDLALARFVAADFEQAASAKLGYTVTVEESWPKVVLWEAGTSSSPYIVNPSGFQIDSLGFDAGCATRGCWVMDVTISGELP